MFARALVVWVALVAAAVAAPPEVARFGVGGMPLDAAGEFHGRPEAAGILAQVGGRGWYDPPLVDFRLGESSGFIAMTWHNTEIAGVPGAVWPDVAIAGNLAVTVDRVDSFGGKYLSGWFTPTLPMSAADAVLGPGEYWKPAPMPFYGGVGADGRAWAQVAALVPEGGSAAVVAGLVGLAGLRRRAGR